MSNAIHHDFLCVVCAEYKRPAHAAEEIASGDLWRIAQLSGQDDLHVCVECGSSPAECHRDKLPQLVAEFGAWPQQDPIGWLLDEKAARAAAHEARRKAAKERRRRRKARARAHQAQRRKAKRQARRALRELRGVRPADVWGREAAWEEALYVEA